MLSTMNIHNVASCTISALTKSNGSTWQTIAAVDKDGNRFEVTFFPSNGMQLIAPTECETVVPK
jgi:hypothetical protein